MMIGTLMKITVEINKLESINSSLGNMKSDLVNLKETSSVFHEKMGNDIKRLRSSLQDKSWIDELELDGNDGDVIDLKETLKSEYVNHIKEKLDSAFRIDNEIMASILSLIGRIPTGERVDEEEIISSLYGRGIKATKYDVFIELERLKERGIVELVVDKKDPNDEVFAIKVAEIEPLELRS